MRRTRDFRRLHIAGQSQPSGGAHFNLCIGRELRDNDTSQ